MNEQNNTNNLNQQDINEVRAQALTQLAKLNTTNDIIGTQIFSILSLNASVIYYPLGEDAPWGFTDIKGTQETNESRRVFVVINSSIPIDCQVFAAAHELYHIWFERKEDIITDSDIDYTDSDKTELKASRFAAELLVPEANLHSKLNSYVKNKNEKSLKDILTLASLFVVPYKTMVRRLYEIGELNLEQQNKFLEVSKNEIEFQRNRYSINHVKADNRIAIANLTELATMAYEKNLITFERLEYLLQKTGLKASDVGITKPFGYQPPSDSELDVIMGE